MAKILYGNNTRKYEFDFRKARVKETSRGADGSERTEVLTKFSMGYLLQNNGDYYYGLAVTLYETTYSYAEVKQRLLAHLEQNDFINVTVIK